MTCSGSGYQILVVLIGKNGYSRTTAYREGSVDQVIHVSMVMIIPEHLDYLNLDLLPLDQWNSAAQQGVRHHAKNTANFNSGHANFCV